EIVLGLEILKIEKRVVDRKNKMTAGLQHAIVLTEYGAPIGYVIEHQRAENEVECSDVEKIQGFRKVRLPDVRSVADPLFGEPDHFRAGVNADHVRAVLDQPLRISTRPAARVQDRQAVH